MTFIHSNHITQLIFTYLSFLNFSIAIKKSGFSSLALQQQYRNAELNGKKDLASKPLSSIFRIQEFSAKISCNWICICMQTKCEIKYIPTLFLTGKTIFQFNYFLPFPTVGTPCPSKYLFFYKIDCLTWLRFESWHRLRQ